MGEQDVSWNYFFFFSLFDLETHLLLSPIHLLRPPPHLAGRRKRYGEAAREKGVLLISQAAYDSVPSDLTVALAEAALRAAGERIARAETFHMIEGGGVSFGFGTHSTWEPQLTQILLNSCQQGRCRP